MRHLPNDGEHCRSVMNRSLAFAQGPARISEVSDDGSGTLTACSGFHDMNNHVLGTGGEQRANERRARSGVVEDRGDMRWTKRRQRDTTPVDVATATCTTEHISQDANGTFQVSREAVVRYGHTYQRLLVEGHARVHLGDQIVVNHYYGQPRIARGHTEQDEATEDNTDDDMTLAATQLLQNFEGNTAQLLRFLRLTAAKLPLPKQIEFKFVALEDALGETMFIDTGFVTDWTSFHYVLSRSFRNRPGHARVARGGYRLADQAQATLLFSPVRPAVAFDGLFEPGKYVQMSIIFQLDELEDEHCARCGLAQALGCSGEIVCERCNFRYQDCFDDYQLDPDYGERTLDPRAEEREQHRRERNLKSDLPGHSHRIGIARDIGFNTESEEIRPDSANSRNANSTPQKSAMHGNDANGDSAHDSGTSELDRVTSNGSEHTSNTNESRAGSTPRIRFMATDLDSEEIYRPRARRNSATHTRRRRSSIYYRENEGEDE